MAARVPPSAGAKLKASAKSRLKARLGKSIPRRLHIGWVEKVSLPALGLLRLPAKVDTGAKTSALHVGPLPAAAERGGEVEVTLPAIPGRHPRSVRLVVHEWVEVRDTSGRRERRPVIRTVLQIGPLRRVIRLGLTDRGDMRYPMLVGRTALGPRVLVDPSARFLVEPPRTAGSRRRTASARAEREQKS